MGESKYIVGIDLGTTNTVVAYTEKRADADATNVQIFDIEQLVALGEVAARSALPSARYHPAAGELADADLQLPWREDDTAAVANAVMGRLANELGAQVPGRLVTSAKSWLSHPSVDRTANILPWGAADDVTKVSPLAASASYLGYVRAAWNHRFPKHPLQSQDVVVTVPASFDEGARALTVQAANHVGLMQLRLVEEPQAAFYDFIYRHGENLASELRDVRLVLVCDVGGGTTDLTLIQVTDGASRPELTRIGVGDHLMLGGDNMDLGLAHVAESRIAASGGSLDMARFSQLIQQCRSAKERLLAEGAPENLTVTVLGAGSKLIGGARSTELTRDEVEKMVVDGFFPVVDPHERPQRQRGGIVEFGLPYASDPAITRHIAEFLERHAHVANRAMGNAEGKDNTIFPVPDAVLLNGGVFRGGRLANRLVDTLQQWRGAGVRVLDNSNPDLAVARGAVAHGLAQYGHAPKIGGGSARSYFLVLDDKDKTKRGVCLLPRAAAEGEEIQLKDRTFALRLGQPVRFHLVSTTADQSYQPGELIDSLEHTFVPLPPIAAVLERDSSQAPNEVPVQLATQLTELGTLDTHCVNVDNPKRRWKLEFQLRGESRLQVSTAAVEAKLPQQFSDAAQRIERMYGGRSKSVEPKDIKRLRNDLEKILGPRAAWETPVLRELSSVLLDDASRRRRSLDHERIWFNLVGFCLRPGFGYPLDDWRIEQLWPIYPQGIQFVSQSQSWSEWWTLWRRISGGLLESAQMQILDDISYYLMPPGHAKRQTGPKKHGYDDMVRLVGSLERIKVKAKVEVGDWLLERLRKSSENPQTWWAVGRLGARVPFYGSTHNIVPTNDVIRWLDQLLTVDWKKVEAAAFAATQLARLSGARDRDLPEALRTQVAEKLRRAKAPKSWSKMIQEVVELNEVDERRVFGESLPPGLRLIH